MKVIITKRFDKEYLKNISKYVNKVDLENTQKQKLFFLLIHFWKNLFI